MIVLLSTFSFVIKLLVLYQWILLSHLFQGLNALFNSLHLLLPILSCPERLKNRQSLQLLHNVLHKLLNLICFCRLLKTQ